MIHVKDSRAYQGAKFGRLGFPGTVDFYGFTRTPFLECQAKERAGVDGAGHNSGKVVGGLVGKWVDDGGWLGWDM